MIPDPLDWLAESLDQLENRGLRRRPDSRRHVAGPVDFSVRHDKNLVNFASNDYLGLAADARLRIAASEAARSRGVGAGASPLVSGRTSLHVELETATAELMGTEAAMLFSSGFAAGAGVISALVEEGDVILSDELNHACLIDGCRLSRARRLIFRHGDTSHLAELLSTTDQNRRRLIVTDTLFSMGGDFAPLVEIGALAEQHQAMLLVDEAHATGVWGPTGGGAVEMFAIEHPQLASQVSIRMGTLSKALGAAGGFVAGSWPLINWLSNRARSYVFSTAPPVPVVAAAGAAIDIVRIDADRRERLQEMAREVRDALGEQGWSTGASTSQIIPVVIGEPRATIELSQRLAEAGLWVPGIRPPTVPDGQSQLRISLRADHEPEQIEQLLVAVGRR